MHFVQMAYATENLQNSVKANDIDAFLSHAEDLLHKRNQELETAPENGRNALNSADMTEALAVLREWAIRDIYANKPSQKAANQTRTQAFDNFSIVKSDIDLEGCSIDVLIMYIFSQRVRILNDTLRQHAREKLRRNEQIEAINQVKTLLAGCQPVQGEAVKEVKIAHSHNEIAKLQLAAREADFDLSAYMDRNLSDEKAKVNLPYAIYQQLNTALNAHTDKYTNLVTSQQLSVVELTKQINLSTEFMSYFNKRLYDTAQAVVSNMR
jgi:hypothetical protein